MHLVDDARKTNGKTVNARQSIALAEVRHWLLADRRGESSGLADNPSIWAALSLAAFAEGGPAPSAEDLLPLAQVFRDLFADVAADVPIPHAIDTLLVDLGLRPSRGGKTALRRVAEVSRASGRVDLILALMARDGLTLDAAIAKAADRARLDAEAAAQARAPISCGPCACSLGRPATD